MNRRVKKNIRAFQDIVPPDDVSEDDFEQRLKLSERKNTPDFFSRDTKKDSSFVEEIHKKREKREKWIARLRIGRKSRYIFAAFVVFLIIGVFYTVIARSMTITLVPQKKIVAMNERFTLSLSGDIAPEVMSFSEKITRAYKTQTQKDISRRAGGTVVIYNVYSSAPQILIRDTRLETPDGKIFRIVKRVTVPGMRKEGGRSIPGSVEVEVLADAAGEGYNVGLSDFSIPGLKGLPHYEKFYARTKTPLEGGFVGTQAIVGEEEVAAARLDITTALKERMVQRAFAKLPNSFMFIEKSAVFELKNFIVEPVVSEPAEEFTVSVEGIFTTIIFTREDFKNSIKKRMMGEEKVYLFDESSLDTTVVDQDFGELRGMVEVSGDAVFIAQIDTDSLYADTRSARNLSEITEILKNTGVVQTATARFNPPWWRRVPASKRITFVVKE